MGGFSMDCNCADCIQLTQIRNYIFSLSLERKTEVTQRMISQQKRIAATHIFAIFDFLEFRNNNIA